MAFCTTCGNQLTEGAQFCTSCGAATAGASSAAPTATPGVAPPKKRSPRVWLVLGVIAGLVVLGAGGWFVFGLVSGGTESGRARAQAEAAADLYEGYTSGDVALIKSALPGELHDVLDTEGLGADDTVTVSRVWEGDVLRLISSSEEYDWENVLEFVADGARDRGTVTVTEVSEDAEGLEPTELVVERQGGRWIVVEMDGEYIGRMIGTTDDGSAGEDSGDESDYDSSEDEARACWTNQRTIEGAAQQYYAAEAENYFSDLEGEVNDMHLLTGEYIAEAPTCPYDDTYYWLYDDGTTGCPSGMHGYYADEQ